METNAEEINFRPKRQQFKLCFAPKCAIGRSYVQVNRPLHTGWCRLCRNMNIYQK